MSFPARYALSVLGFLGFFVLFGSRVNLSVAIVAMVKKPNITISANSKHVVACPHLALAQIPIGNVSITETIYSERGEFDWDAELQGQILASFFYGYIVTQIPGGLLAEQCGAKWTLGFGVLLTSVFSLLTPVATRWSVWALIFCRVVEGLAQGVTFPAMNTLIGRWSPKMERNRLSTIIYSGSHFGTVFALALSGILCDSDFLEGWPSVFYVFGVMGCVWFIVWIFLVFEFPEDHPRISSEELFVINLDKDNADVRKPAFPWKDILTSVPVWALIFAHFGQAYGYYTLLIEMPLYLDNVLHFELKENGVLSALPNLLNALTSILASFIADKLRSSNTFKISTIRKGFNTIGYYIPGLCLVAAAFLGCEYLPIVILLTLAMCVDGFVYSGCLVNHLDMSPEFAGTLYGLTNCFANTCGFIVPTYVGFLTKDGHTTQAWGQVFITSALVVFGTGLIFIIFGSADLQPWSLGPVIKVTPPPEEVTTKPQDLASSFGTEPTSCHL